MKNIDKYLFIHLICLNVIIFNLNASASNLKEQSIEKKFNISSISSVSSGTEMESTIPQLGFTTIDEEQNLGFSEFDKTRFDSLGRGDIIDYEGTHCRALNPEKFAHVTPSKWGLWSKSDFHGNIKKIGEIFLNESLEEFLGTGVEGNFTLAHFRYSRSDKYPDLYILFGRECSDTDYDHFYHIFQNVPMLNNFTKTNATSDYDKRNHLEIKIESHARRSYGNLTQKSSKNRLSPLALYAINTETFKPLHPKSSLETRDFGGARLMSVFDYITNSKGELVVLSSPAHDLPHDANPLTKTMSGGLSLNEVWSYIEKFTSARPENVTQILIPIGESNSLYGMDRKHWTLLSLTKNNDSWTAEFYNSKGIGDNLYNRQNIIKFLQRNIPSLQTFKMNFLGHQGVMNNEECGFFVAAYAATLIRGEDITSMRTDDVRTTFGELEKNMFNFR